MGDRHPPRVYDNVDDLSSHWCACISYMLAGRLHRIREIGFAGIEQTSVKTEDEVCRSYQKTEDRLNGYGVDVLDFGQADSNMRLCKTCCLVFDSQ